MRRPRSRALKAAMLGAGGALVVAACQPTAKAQDDRESAESYRDGRGNWGFDPRATSAGLARSGWRFLTMSTLSWPDGRQAVVTMWMNNLGDHARCFDYFDGAMKPTGGKCERTGTGI